MIELRDEGNRHRREGLRAVIAWLGRVDALHAELSQGRALDRAWIITAVEPYISATEGCGWSDQEYAVWLTTLLHQQLLNPHIAA